MQVASPLPSPLRASKSVRAPLGLAVLLALAPLLVLAPPLALAPLPARAQGSEQVLRPEQALRPLRATFTAEPSASATTTATTTASAAAISPAASPSAAPGRSLRPLSRTEGLALVGGGRRPGPLETRPLARAMDAVRAGRWDEALALARDDGRTAVDIVEWHRLRAGEGTAREVLAFLTRNGDWPGLPLLRRRSEKAFLAASPRDVLAFFAGHEPQTAEGALALARALRAAGRADEAREVLGRAWVQMETDPEIEAAFLAEPGARLARLHEARLDALLWRGRTEAARRMLPRVPASVRAVAEARLAFLEGRDDAPELARKLPPAQAEGPGLAHAEFTWARRRGDTDRAVALIRERSRSAARLGRPEAWASGRRALARRLLADGRPREAYLLAARHHLPPGVAESARRDLEWLAGYVALVRLDDPRAARRHFATLEAIASSPVSRARAGYWLGRAEEALNARAAALAAYRRAADHQSTFYGLLAAERGGVPFDMRLAGTSPLPDWEGAKFRESSVFRAAVLLMAADEVPLGVRFFTHLAESLDAADMARMAALAAEMGEPYFEVMLGKRAARYGVSLPAPHFALHPLARLDHPVPTELVLAIARRESEFYPRTVSPAGARGLMQLMPATAREMAGRLDLRFDRAALTADWAYNVRLGGAYLSELAERYQGNPVLIAVAYNAGPTRADRWLAALGDFRRGEIDVVSWIESLPYAETRNYAMRVTESLPVYRARLGLDPLPLPFSKLLVSSAYLPRTP